LTCTYAGEFQYEGTIWIQLMEVGTPSLAKGAIPSVKSEMTLQHVALFWH